MAAFLEFDMLTTAFVATYVRLHTGGSGSGFARDALPEALRSAHDELIDMRNKRYAHVAEHDSVGSVAKIVKLEHAWRRLDGRNDDGFQVAPFPGCCDTVGGALVLSLSDPLSRS